VTEATDIAATVKLLAGDGATVELRIPNVKDGWQHNAAGYFRDYDKAADEAAKWEQRSEAIYVTLNVVDPELFSRSADRITKGLKHTTRDENIQARRWILFDLDPVRPTGVSASEEEHQLALDLGERLRDWLVSFGFPARSLVLADSGNGCHVLARIDLPNDSESEQLVKGCLSAVDLHLSDDRVKVDVTVSNASRITKLYGTMAAKGDDIPERPHRRSRLLEYSDSPEIAPRELLERLAGLIPRPIRVDAKKPKEGRRSAKRGERGPSIAVEALIERLGLEVAFTKPWSNAQVSVLRVCPFDPDHNDLSARIIQLPDGGLAFKCFHRSCDGKSWTDVVSLLDPSLGKDANHGYPTDAGNLDELGNLLDADEPEAVIVTMSEVTPATVDWLWKDRIPLGKLTMLDGDPGVGKSLLTADLAARVSSGRTMPDDTPSDLSGPADVLLLSAEDGPADTIRPRLEAAGADLDRVHLMPAVRTPDEDERLVVLPADLPAIKKEIMKRNAKLTIIDPLVAYLSADIDVNKDQSVRHALRPMSDMAAETGAAVVLVRHLNKNKDSSPVRRGGGSIGLIAAARSGLVVGVDPDDSSRRVIAAIKSNVGPEPSSLAFRIDSDTSAAGSTPVIRWEGEVLYSATDLLADRDPTERDVAPSRVEEAQNFLLDLLRDGPVWSQEVLAEARPSRIFETTLNRAKKSLGVRSYREADRWMWMLPEEDYQDYQDCHGCHEGQPTDNGHQTDEAFDDPNRELFEADEPVEFVNPSAEKVVQLRPNGRRFLLRSKQESMVG
jgi:hypothetical protein